MNYQGKLKIKAGESIWIWGRDAVSVVENTGFQVKAVDLKGKSMNIITSGNKLTGHQRQVQRYNRQLMGV